ncbi:MAG TPA: type VII secretion target [Asanoa sp.]|jgi:hypothetical protein
MRPGDDVTVRPSALVAHATHVDAVGSAVDSAGQAGAATRPGAEAYGRLCTIVPMLLGQLQSHVVGGIAAAGDSLRDTAGRLRTAADGYGGSDQRSASTVSRAGGSW